MLLVTTCFPNFECDTAPKIAVITVTQELVLQIVELRNKVVAEDIFAMRVPTPNQVKWITEGSNTTVVNNTTMSVTQGTVSFSCVGVPDNLEVTTRMISVSELVETYRQGNPVFFKQ